jgi:demethylmenaquinone methyltransferase/2-methoxy-6-polyprenyl-1,4-benzoquinol methylase
LLFLFAFMPCRGGRGFYNELMSAAAQAGVVSKPCKAPVSHHRKSTEPSRNPAEPSTGNGDSFSEQQQDQLDRIITLGLGPWYRREALLRAGLSRGVRVLDISLRPGAMTRELAEIVGDVELVHSVDARLLAGDGIRIPKQDQHFGLVCVRYAFGGGARIPQILKEAYRVLRPGGRVCILEIAAANGLYRKILRGYAQYLVPLMLRIGEQSALLDVPRDFWHRYAGSIGAAIPAERMEQHLLEGGYGGIRRRMELGVFCELTATRPQVLTAKRMDDILLDDR